jgi:hypothetical protein
MVDTCLENVKYLSISKHGKSYVIEIENKKIHVPMATNFEWRMEKPIEITHMYFGTETGKYKDFSFNVSFNIPCKIRVSNHGRCYLYISKTDRKGE